METFLKNKVFFIHDNDGRISDILKRDLVRVIDLIKREIKNTSIILGGSLAYGEGRYVERNGKFEFLSDFDIFLIIPSLTETIRSMRNPHLKNLRESLGLLNPVELIFVWEKMLSLKLTTVAGEILVDNGRIKKILNNLPIPRATNNLKRAYKYLLFGLLDYDKRNEYLDRALIQGFQVLLMISKKDSGYETWNKFFSLRFDLEEVDSFKDLLEEDIYILIKDALEDFLGIKKKDCYGIKDFFLTREFLNEVYLKLSPALKVNDYLRYMTFHLKNGKMPNPFINSTWYYLNSAKLLLNSIQDFNRFDDLRLKEAERMLNKLTGEKNKGENSEEIFRRSVEKLKKYDEFYIHKIKQKTN